MLRIQNVPGPHRQDTCARRAGRGTLNRLACAALGSGRRAPSEDWLAGLAPGDRHVGVPVGDAARGWVLAVWAGETSDGERAGAVLEIRVGDWLALAEVAVPPPVRRWARELAAESG